MESALMTMTYTECVHTFKDDFMSVEKKNTSSERIIKTKVPFRITTGKNKDMMTIICEI